MIKDLKGGLRSHTGEENDGGCRLFVFMEVEQVNAAPERNEFKLSPAEFKFVEHKLFTYQNNKHLIEEYLAQRDELIQEHATPSPVCLIIKVWGGR